ncbi:MAG: hypothetical protein MUO26_16035 [Methanotrichaceae archaeon]|nr:hypothetical protein [Methanotrichaceae archaeon]
MDGIDKKNKNKGNERANIRDCPYYRISSLNITIAEIQQKMRDLGFCTNSPHVMGG